MQEIDYLGIENNLIRKGLSFHTIPKRIGGIRRLEREGALENKQAFDDYIVRFLRRGGSKSYFNKELQSLKDWGEFYGIGWVKEIGRLKAEETVRASFSDKEVENFLALDSTLFWKCFWSLWAHSGCRPMEIRTVLTKDVNLQTGTVIFRSTKTHKDREVPISETIRPLLEEYLPSAGKYLFGIKNQVMSDRTYLKDFQHRCIKLGITGRQPYSFRHSFITRLLQEDAPLFVVQDIVGHTDPETTRHYYHGNVKAMHKAIKKDPLTRKTLTPSQSLQQLIELVRPYIEQNEHFTYSISDSSISITCRGK